MRRVLMKRRMPNVEWVGGTDNPADFYRRASVFVSPSISDAGPRTVLEAMACGVPSIVSDHCGIAGAIAHGDNGFVYRYDDVAELAQLLKWSYQNRTQLRDMGRKARAMVEGYNVHNYSREIEQRIAAVMEAVQLV
jgi:glycosyltransferase involved in cell wall biosynthesis